jgi:hypothetical protein
MEQNNKKENVYSYNAMNYFGKFYKVELPFTEDEVKIIREILKHRGYILDGGDNIITSSYDSIMKIGKELNLDTRNILKQLMNLTNEQFIFLHYIIRDWCTDKEYINIKPKNFEELNYWKNIFDNRTSYLRKPVKCGIHTILCCKNKTTRNEEQVSLIVNTGLNIDLVGECIRSLYYRILYDTIKTIFGSIFLQFGRDNKTNNLIFCISEKGYASKIIGKQNIVVFFNAISFF